MKMRICVKCFYDEAMKSITITVMILFTSCSFSPSRHITTDTTMHDSISTETSVTDERPNILPHLPDTIYPSAHRIRYKIYVTDTLCSGELSSIDNLYNETPGVFTFRKGAMRDADFGGIIDSVPTRISVDWIYRTSYDTVSTKYGRWGGGTGWTGQPLYVEWPDSCMSLFPSNVAKKEVIIGSLDRNLHFIDFETGKRSRTPIYVENPIKGTPSLDPELNGNLYVGHGVPALGDFGAEVIDLYQNQRTHFFGRDPKAWRGWNAYDSSPIRVSRFLFRPGENGSIYKFAIAPGRLALHSTLNYSIDGYTPGIESSMAVWRNYGYVADNAGNIICINLNTIKPVWRYKLPDDTDATPVIAEENGQMYLYVGCEVEHEGVNEAVFAKLDALNGYEIWRNSIPAARVDIDGKHFDGGYYASPLLGSGDCSHLVFDNIVTNSGGRNGKLVAFDRDTGRTVYSVKLRYYAWSSPVGFLDCNGNMYIFTADCSGRVYLFRGIDGHLITSESIGANFESSPVVVGNSIVVGSRGTNIYRLSIQ